MRSSSILLVARCIFKILQNLKMHNFAIPNAMKMGFSAERYRKLLSVFYWAINSSHHKILFLIFSPSLSSMSNPFCQLRLTGWGTEIWERHVVFLLSNFKYEREITPTLLPTLMIILMRNMVPDIIIFKAICKGFTSEIPNDRPVLHIFVRSNTKDTMYHSFVSEFSCFEKNWKEENATIKPF